MELKNNINQTQLREAIVKTVAYFDLFEFPLTGYEIWQYLNVKCELAEVMAILNEEIQPPLPPLSGGQIESKNGFYCLVGREDIIIERMRRYNYYWRKYKLAVRAAKIFKVIPWIKMIAISNLMGEHNLRDESDIDLFIITEDKKIWLTRFFCIVISKLLGWRPQVGKTRDKICLSFFVSQEKLNLSDLRINNKIDIYFIYWLAGLVPVYDTDDTYEQFILANNWLIEQLPNWQPFKQRQYFKLKPFSAFYGEITDLLLAGLEQRLKIIQLRLLPTNLKNIMNLDTRVVINDRVLKLHLNDRREEYRQLYENKIRNLEKIKSGIKTDQDKL